VSSAHPQVQISHHGRQFKIDIECSLDTHSFQDIPAQGRRKRFIEHDLLAAPLTTQEENGEKKSQLPPLEINTPRDSVLPPIKT
jgi:hypothetical protein